MVMMASQRYFIFLISTLRIKNTSADSAHERVTNCGRYCLMKTEKDHDSTCEEEYIPDQFGADFQTLLFPVQDPGSYQVQPAQKRNW